MQLQINLMILILTLFVGHNITILTMTSAYINNHTYSLLMTWGVT